MGGREERLTLSSFYASMFLINYYCLLISASPRAMLDCNGDTLLDFREAGLGEHSL
jgi:hypothetical protein